MTNKWESHITMCFNARKMQHLPMNRKTQKVEITATQKHELKISVKSRKRKQITNAH